MIFMQGTKIIEAHFGAQMISGIISALAWGIFTAWNPCVSTYFYRSSGTRNITTIFTLDKSKQLCIPISSFIFL